MTESTDITKRRKMKPPATSTTVPRQLELFAHFFGDDEYSNTVDLWDSVPKHCLNPRQQAALRDERGRLEVFEHRFDFHGRPCRVEVTPARVVGEGGGRIDCFPSHDEKLVETVLRKIFVDGQHGGHDPRELESWVTFTLGMIRRELKARNRTRSIDQIKRSIEIMNLTTVRIFLGNDANPVYSGSILPDVVRVSRDEWLADASTRWGVRLPTLVSKSINDHTYRQLNYRIWFELAAPFAQWLFERMSHRFIQAGFPNTYRMSLSSMQRDSGLLRRSRPAANVKIVEDALNEMVAREVLLSWKKEEERGKRNSIVDVTYELMASPKFKQDQIESNARAKAIRIDRGEEQLSRRGRSLKRGEQPVRLIPASTEGGS